MVAYSARFGCACLGRKVIFRKKLFFLFGLKKDFLRKIHLLNSIDVNSLLVMGKKE